MMNCLQCWHPVIPKQVALQTGWDYEELIWRQKREVRGRLRKEIRAVLNSLKE